MVEEKQQQVMQEKQRVVELEGIVHAMQALMNTVCEVVFRAGESLRITDSNARLDALLGPTSGRILEEYIPNSLHRAF